MHKTVTTPYEREISVASYENFSSAPICLTIRDTYDNTRKVSNMSLENAIELRDALTEAIESVPKPPLFADGDIIMFQNGGFMRYVKDGYAYTFFSNVKQLPISDDSYKDAVKVGTLSV